MDYKLKSAKDCSLDEIRTFKEIVMEAKEVIEDTFDRLIQKNPILLFMPNSKEVKGIGALKIPNKSYKEKVFRKSKSPSMPEDFQYELGWIVSLEPNRKIGQTITKVLSNYKFNIYSTVRTKNEKMNHILEKSGFKKSGNSYDSERDEYQVSLYIKENLKSSNPEY